MDIRNDRERKSRLYPDSSVFFSNKEIADTLVIAEGTVKNHLTSILSKLEARDRMQAVIKAREFRLI